MYGQIGEDAFPWSSNPGAGTNSGQYMPPLAYRSSLSQSNNSFSRSSLWPSMNNLVSSVQFSSVQLSTVFQFSTLAKSYFVSRYTLTIICVSSSRNRSMQQRLLATVKRWENQIVDPLV